MKHYVPSYMKDCADYEKAIFQEGFKGRFSVYVYLGLSHVHSHSFLLILFSF